MNTLRTLPVVPVVPILAASLWVFSGCQPEPSSGDDTVEQRGTARLTLVDEAHATAGLKVSAKLADSGKLVDERLVAVDGTSVVDLSLPSGAYEVDIHACSDAACSTPIGVKAVKVKIGVGLTTKVDVKVALDAQGKVGLAVFGDVEIKAGATVGAGVTVGGGATVGAGATAGGGASAGAELCIPIIDKVDVAVGLTSVKIDVKASASAGGALTFVWSGAGIKGQVVGSASAELSVDAVLAASLKTVQVIVQSKDGVAALVEVKLDVAAGLLGALKLAGTAQVSIKAAAELAVSVKACLDVHAQCTAACKASTTVAGGADVQASCLVACAVKLSGCCTESYPK